jgi:dihydroorotase
MTILSITKPDDWHIHLRDGEFLATTVAHASKRFERAIVMPNLIPPICDINQANSYRAAILAARPPETSFTPLMTLYLTDLSTTQLITQAKQSGIIWGCKLYPAGSTTHAESGVTFVEKLFPVFEKMEEVDLVLLIHGETTDPRIDIFDREAAFLENTLSPLIRRFPKLRMVLEHITTQEAVQFVQESSDNIAATITAHHLLMNRNDIFSGGIKPHHYCLPILKRRHHQDALIKAAASGESHFFIGTDSAPHPKENKESSCGCAGIYTAHAAIELYCEAFEQANALEKLEAFLSFHGPDFYQLPRNQQKITLIKEDWKVPLTYPYANTQLVPFRAGSIAHWKLLRNND